jgi:hypothetical protein
MQALKGSHGATHLTRNQKNIRKILVQIAQELDQLPSPLLVHGVRLQKPEAVDYGGYAEVYHGKLAGADVALKRFRIFNKDTADSKRKVSDLSKVNPSAA